MVHFVSQSDPPLQKTLFVSIFRGPRPCAMIICGQLARAKAATDLRIFMCSGSLGFFILRPSRAFFYLKMSLDSSLRSE